MNSKTFEDINVYLVESPFQLLSAIEAKNFFNKKNKYYNLIIIKYSGDCNNDNLINELLKYDEWNEIFTFNNTQGTLVDFRFLKIIKNIQRKYSKVNVFVGFPENRNFQWFCEKIKNSECYLLDDGTLTISLVHNYFSKGDFLQKSDRVCKSVRSNLLLNTKNIIKIFIIKYFFGLKHINNIHYKLFSCFRFDKTDLDIINHDFSFIKSKITDLEVKNDLVYFYGSPLSENKIIPENIEINMISEVRDYYERNGLSLIYIPHRSESKHKLDKISDMSIKVKHNRYIAELEPINSKEIPQEISSFLSTSLYTLSLIYDIPVITSFRIDNKYIHKDRINRVSSVYNEYKKYFKIIDLSIDRKMYRES
jgi:hypothetical protein